MLSIGPEVDNRLRGFRERCAAGAPAAVARGSGYAAQWPEGRS